MAVAPEKINRRPVALQVRDDLRRRVATGDLAGGDQLPPEIECAEAYGVSRATVMNHLRKHGIGTQVHYIPVHLQPYYRRLYGTGPGDFPRAEKYYSRALSLPLYPELAPSDIMRVMHELGDALAGKKQAAGQHYIANR